MRAAVCREFRAPLVIEELLLGPVGRNEVRVEVAACAVCHSDIHYAEGSWGGTLPAVYGHEAAGVVSEIGAGVSEVCEVGVGDRVAVSLIRSCGICPQCQRGCQVFCETDLGPPAERLQSASGEVVQAGLRCGAFAQEVLVHHSQVVALPAGISWPAAALLGCGVITGVGAVINTSSVDATSTVAVIGAGGVGLNTIQGARLAGAPMIIGIDITDHKLDTARRFGATHTALASGDVAEALRRATGQAGVTHVFVTVGSSAAMSAGLELLVPGGELVLVGMPALGTRLEIDPLELADTGRRILGSKMGSGRLRPDLERILAWYRDGSLKLDELVTGVYPLDHINDAIAEVSTGAAIRNVIAMRAF